MNHESFSHSPDQSQDFADLSNAERLYLDELVTKFSDVEVSRFFNTLINYQDARGGFHEQVALEAIKRDLPKLEGNALQEFYFYTLEKRETDIFTLSEKGTEKIVRFRAYINRFVAKIDFKSQALAIVQATNTNIENITKK